MNGDSHSAIVPRTPERCLPGDRQAMALLVGGLPDSQEIGMSRSRSCHPRGCDSVFKVLPPSPICFTPPVGLVTSTLADVASLRA